MIEIGQELVDCLTWQYKDSSWRPAMMIWRQPKVAAPIFEWIPNRSLTPETQSLNKHMLELQKKTRKKIQGLCLLFLFSQHFISLCRANTVDSVYMLLLSSQRQLKSVSKLSKVCDCSWGWLEGSLFNSYNSKVQGRALLLSLDFSNLPLICT